MGKRIISQARGHGSLSYRVPKQAYRYKVKYPMSDGPATIIKILHSPAHSAPLMKLIVKKEIFFSPAFNNAFEGQVVTINGNEQKTGNVLMIKNIAPGTSVYNIERNPGDGGKMTRTSGGFATLVKKEKNSAKILMPNKKEIILNENCRATLGVIAGDGRLLKPFVTAGKKHFKMKARNKLWPRTSAVKVNAVDHPFGSGRGKRIKSKIAVRNAPPGKKVGHLRPRRTGRKK